jgi:ADP-ribosylation factor GTPase-activating protein 2/3
MRLSGNENARSFFKKHGVTDAQMISEKKYKTKAAQEYRRHLQKLIDGEATASTAADDVEDELKSAGDTERGIDSMMLSLSNSADGNLIKIVHASSEVSEPIYTNVPAQAGVSTKSLVQAVGSLSVESNNITTNPSSESAVEQMKAVKSVAKKSNKKVLGAKKMDSSAGELYLESFDKVEEQVQRVIAPASNPSTRDIVPSRVSLAYTEVEEKRAPSNSADASMYRASSTVGSGAGSGTSSRVKAGSTEESFTARSKYSSSKGISSDQYFGREDQDQDLIKSKLQSYSNSKSISSDMMSGTDPDGDIGFEASSGLGALKDSVASFFSDVSKQIGHVTETSSLEPGEKASWNT